MTRCCCRHPDPAGDTDIPTERTYRLLLVATGVALSFTPTTMVIASGLPDARTGLASGLAGSATQIGAALGVAAFTAIGMDVAGESTGALGAAAFSAAFTAAAAVAVLTAALGITLTRVTSGQRATRVARRTPARAEAARSARAR